MKDELYISVDIEADGPIPGDHSMLSLGAAAFMPDGQMIGIFSANIFPLESAHVDPETMKFWEKHQEAWEKLQVDQLSPHQAMNSFDHWLRTFGEAKLVYVAYPVTFDFGFTHWYFHHFLGKDPFGFQGLDLKTYAMAVLGTQFKETVKSAMPSDWFKTEGGHQHVALDDAVEQGLTFLAMKNERRERDA